MIIPFFIVASVTSVVTAASVIPVESVDWYVLFRWAITGFLGVCGIYFTATISRIDKSLASLWEAHDTEAQLKVIEARRCGDCRETLATKEEMSRCEESIQKLICAKIKAHGGTCPVKNPGRRTHPRSE